jgi:hypothetical protein
MKQILLSAVILYLIGLSYAAFEPVSQFYLQIKEIETLNRIDSFRKQNKILNSRYTNHRQGLSTTAEVHSAEVGLQITSAVVDRPCRWL